jgi:hypothetical protein
MNHPHQQDRSPLFEQAVDALRNELATRLAQLHARKSDIRRLQDLAEDLRASGWNARADVATHTHSGAILRLWINVDSCEAQADLLNCIGAKGIGIARQEFQDLADTIGYKLALSDRLWVLLRVGITRRAAARVTA